MKVKSRCPVCKTELPRVFPKKCPNCSFNIEGLAGKSTFFVPQQKWIEHTDLIRGDIVQLYRKTYNASFTFNGVARIEDLVRFSLTFGEWTTLSTDRGLHNNTVVVCYFPETIGSASAIHYPSLVPCSGVMTISPQSPEYGHAFPAIDEWIHKKFIGMKSTCRECGKETDFGVPICKECYKNGFDWEEMMKQ